MRLFLLLTVVAGCSSSAAAPSPSPIETQAPAAPTPTCGPAAIETIGSLSTGRYAPSLARLPDGRVILAGGYAFTSNESHATSEAIAPELGVGPALVNGRNFAASVVGEDGTVTLFGGFDPLFGSLDDVETLKPGGAAFRAKSATMSVPREAHTATLLADGRILIIGGLKATGFVFHDTTEVWDGTAFSASAKMSTARAFHTTTRLANGDVLVVGGDSGKGELASAERFDGTKFVATKNGRVRAGKAVASAVLSDGRVLIAGGANAKDGSLADTDIYDPSTDSFMPGPPMNRRRMAHSLTSLPDGRILAVGGWSDSESPAASSGVVEIFDGTTWKTLDVHLAQPRHDHAVVVVDDCHVLIAGGQQSLPNKKANAPLEIERLSIPSL